MTAGASGDQLDALDAALPADPIEACARLRRSRGRVLLHSARNDDALGGWSFVAAEPVATLIIRGKSIVLLDREGRPGRRWSGDPLVAISEFLVAHGAALDGAVPAEPGHPRVIGYLGYDLGRQILPHLGRGPTRGDDCPDVWLGAYDAIARWPDDDSDSDPAPDPDPDPDPRRRPQLLGEPAARRRLAELLRRGEPAPGLAPHLGPLAADDSADHHRARVERVLEYIAAGDVYQVNLARRHVAKVRSPGDPLALYHALAAKSPAPYGGLLEADGLTLISSSPERFLRVIGDRVETRPIKGTRPRVADAGANRAAAADLAAAEKDSAEHLMIVDLERNDLGRVAEVGSVTVDDLGYVVDFATVLHRVSRISARLAPGTDHAALLAATFPGGSITGAPKLRAMQLIDELEPARRGPYCGALGYFGAGELDLAISIRVGALTSTELRIHVGGGIVADSSPAAELTETEDKLAGWRRALAAADPDVTKR